MSSDAHSLEVQIAELRGVVVTRLDNLTHDMKNMAMSMTALVPRREVEEVHKRREDAHHELEKRVDQLEATNRKVTWAIIVAWLAGLGVAVKALGPH